MQTDGDELMEVREQMGLDRVIQAEFREMISETMRRWGSWEGIWWSGSPLSFPVEKSFLKTGAFVCLSRCVSEQLRVRTGGLRLAL